MVGIKNKFSHTMWFTVHKLGETSWCSVESKTCNQYSARRANGQLAAERNSSMGFHDHIVAWDPKIVHNDNQWSDQTHCNAVTCRGPSCMRDFVHLRIFVFIYIITPQLHAYHMTPSFMKLTQKYAVCIFHNIIKWICVFWFCFLH